MNIHEVNKLAFVGHIRCGKTWISNQIAREFLHPGKVFSFATRLKEEVADMISIQTDGTDPKVFIAEMSNPMTKDKYRYLLQGWGDFRRSDDLNYFVDHLSRTLNSEDEKELGFGLFNFISRQIVDDCRFPNEYNMLRRRGFIFVRLAPNPNDVHESLHISESFSDYFDVEIDLPWSTEKERVSDLWNQLSRL